MKRYLATVQYIGKNYSGYQRQDNGTSIQQVIEESLESVFKQKVEVFASGRTDAGVNAYAQTIHFDADITIPAKKIPLAVNIVLPDDIKFLSCKEVSSDFNARFDVKKKTYEYSMYVSNVMLPTKEYSYWLKKMPDIEKMKACAKIICGKHDFRAFMSTGSQAKTFERTVYSIKIKQKKNEIIIDITGNGFLYNMVRIIVGTLIEVGYGKKTIDDVKNALNSKKRKYAGYLVPPYALFLKEVKYWYKTIIKNIKKLVDKVPKLL